MNPLQADHGKGRSKLFMEHPGKAWFRILIGFQNNSPDPGMTFALEIRTEQLARMFHEFLSRDREDGLFSASCPLPAVC